jgi:hypothetical protein
LQIPGDAKKAKIICGMWTWIGISMDEHLTMGGKWSTNATSKKRVRLCGFMGNNNNERYPDSEMDSMKPKFTLLTSEKEQIVLETGKQVVEKAYLMNNSGYRKFTANQWILRNMSLGDAVANSTFVQAAHL